MKLLLSVLTVFGLSTLAYSGETSIEIDQGMLISNSNSTKQGDADAEKTATMYAYDAHTQVKVSHGDWHFYFFPNAQLTAADLDKDKDGVSIHETEALKFGMNVNKDIEAGLWFGMASSKKDDGIEASSSSFGLYGLYTHDLGGGGELEAELGYQMITLNTKNPKYDTGAGTAELDNKISGSIMNLDVEYIRHIGGAWHYVGGLNYKSTAVENELKVAGNKVDDQSVKTTMTDTAIKLVGFRFAF